MSLVADQADNWRGSYDGWLSHDRRNDDPEPREPLPKECCPICGSNQRGPVGLTCHTARQRDAANNAARAATLADIAKRTADE